jgi:hypothetical protein
MSLPDDDTKHNVVRLGTETLFAIAEQLRRMYDADLRHQALGGIERLMRRIERGRGRSLGERRRRIYGGYGFPHRQQRSIPKNRHSKTLPDPTFPSATQGRVLSWFRECRS